MLFFSSLLLLPLLCGSVPLNSTATGREFLSSRSMALSSFKFLAPNYDMSAPFKRFVPNLKKIPTRAVENCYEAKLNGVRLDLFHEKATLFDVLYNFYLTQPNKQVSLESIENLIHSAQNIVEHVHDCSQQARGYKLGFTELSDLSEDEFRQRLGVMIVEDSGSSIDSIKRAVPDQECFPPKSYKPPKEFDFRAHKVVSPVKNQGTCGSCWTFSTAATIESAYMIRKSQSLDLSEQQLVDCAYWQGMGGCSAGTSFQGYDYVLKNGITSEAQNPYRGYPFGCRANFRKEAAIRKFCIRGQNTYGPPAMIEKLTDEAIVAALGFFGPLGVYINADRLQNYKSGIVNDQFCSKQVNHAVTLVGYTENSWIIKNSWGTNWGNGGFFQLARGKNMCGVNFEINFPLL